jgi:hypothetical protein
VHSYLFCAQHLRGQLEGRLGQQNVPRETSVVTVLPAQSEELQFHDLGRRILVEIAGRHNRRLAAVELNFHPGITDHRDSFGN